MTEASDGEDRKPANILDYKHSKGDVDGWMEGLDGPASGLRP